MDDSILTSETIRTGLDLFFHQYIVNSVDQSIQIFQSFTFGEMTIATLLFILVLLFSFKWIWEVLR